MENSDIVPRVASGTSHQHRLSQPVHPLLHEGLHVKQPKLCLTGGFRRVDEVSREKTYVHKFSLICPSGI